MELNVIAIIAIAVTATAFKGKPRVFKAFDCLRLLASGVPQLVVALSSVFGYSKMIWNGALNQMASVA